jgi:hypothetical protein
MEFDFLRNTKSCSSAGELNAPGSSLAINAGVYLPNPTRQELSFIYFLLGIAKQPVSGSTCGKALIGK